MEGARINAHVFAATSADSDGYSVSAAPTTGTADMMTPPLADGSTSTGRYFCVTTRSML